ncbi:hypothetical protein ACFQDZ_07775 [Sulfitobacter pacificus]|uniref:hypothetical protein n=1 Tax=Sulfitobacter pacificus TaxID=1499314 RepID=UPI003621C0D5
MKMLILPFVLFSWACVVNAQSLPLPQPPTEEPAMTLQRLAQIVQALDPDVVARGPALEFTLDDIPIIVIADAGADRMRAMVPIASAEGLEKADLLRLMQANFDAALDARYAVANGRLWGCSFTRCPLCRRISSSRGWCRRSPSQRPMALPIPGGCDLWRWGHGRHLS